MVLERNTRGTSARDNALCWGVLVGIQMSGNPNYPYSYPLKMLIWISVFVVVFIWMPDGCIRI
jgi:hypothetical protein